MSLPLFYLEVPGFMGGSTSSAKKLIHAAEKVYLAMVQRHPVAAPAYLGLSGSYWSKANHKMA